MTLYEFFEYDKLKCGSKEEKDFLARLPKDRPRKCNGTNPANRQMCENCPCIDGFGIVCCDKGQHMMHMYQVGEGGLEEYLKEISEYEPAKIMNPIQLTIPFEDYDSN